MIPVKKRMKEDLANESPEDAWEPEDLGLMERPIRLAFMQSDPDVVHGQIWDYRTFFPRGIGRTPFKVGNEKQDDGSYVEWLEAYDGLLTKMLESSPSVKLVHVYNDFGDICDDLRDKDELPYNCLWAGSWIFYAVDTYDEAEPRNPVANLEEALELFGTIARRKGVCIFPPIEYAIKFARKAQYLEELQTRIPLPKFLTTPLTCVMDMDDRRWKTHALEWKELVGVDRIMFKREISGRGNHVFIVRKKEDLPAIRESSLQWFVQPYYPAFDKSPEFRMYVVDGVCKWGVATQKDTDIDALCLPVDHRSKLWKQGGREAAKHAADFARNYCEHLGNPPWLCREPGKVWFLRVDMVAMDKSYSSWLINELEFFGNADLHFEVMELAETYLEDIRVMAQCYLGHTFANCFGTMIPEDLEMVNILFAQRTQGALRRLHQVPDLEEVDSGPGARASDINVFADLEPLVLNFEGIAPPESDEEREIPAPPVFINIQEEYAAKFEADKERLRDQIVAESESTEKPKEELKTRRKFYLDPDPPKVRRRYRKKGQ